jgi:phosphoglycerate dehydrogenase-like enzyme
MRIAILDDYQDIARSCADWSRLPQGHEVTVFHDHVPDADVEGLRRRLEPFDIVCIVRERTTMRIGLIEKLPNLKLIVLGGTGSSVVDIAEAGRRGIMVCGARPGGAGGVPAEEHTFALMMALARNIVPENQSVRAGGWQVGLARSLRGSTLAVLGLGRLGPNLAGFGRAFGMKVIAWSQNMTQEQASAAGAELVSKDELFRRADFLTVLLRLSERTIGMVGERELSLMKKTAFLINTSRGPIVDNASLVKALAERRIAGAALDVFASEPLAPDDPLRNTPRLLITPHCGYVTEEQMRFYHTSQLEAILAFLDGRPINVLDERHQVHRPNTTELAAVSA